MSFHVTKKTPPVLRGTSPLNFSTIVWCEISKLVKSVLSYLLMLHPFYRIAPYLLTTHGETMSFCLGFTPSQKSGNNEKTTGPHEFELQCSDLLDTWLTLFREPTCKDRCQWTRSEHHPWHTQGQATKDENCGNPKLVYAGTSGKGKTCLWWESYPDQPPPEM